MDTDSRPPYFQLSSDNHSPWVVIVSVVFLAYAILGAGTKIISRLQMKVMMVFDWLVIIATMFAFVQTITTVAACRHGLGQRQASLTSSSLDEALRYIYASRILYILSQAFAKASLTFFILSITPQRALRLACYCLLAVVAGWAVAGTLALAFICRLPSPWLTRDQTCSGLEGLFIALGVINIMTDVALVVMPIIMMWGVQTRMSRKLQIIGLFTFRILVPALTIPQIVTFKQHITSDDVTFSATNTTIWMSIVMNISIITACIPSLKGVLDMFWAGTSLMTMRANADGLYSPGSYGLRSLFKTKFLEIRYGGSRMQMSGDPSSTMHSTNRPTSYVMQSVNGGIPERSESQRSLKQNTILRTVDYKVEYQENDGTHNHITSTRNAYVHAPAMASDNLSHNSRSASSAISDDHIAIVK